jgi:GNAT superfamily N-acetyltransferase
MKIKQQEINARGIKFIASDNDKEIGRAYLYLLTNDLHDVPFGFIEDVFVSEEYRGQGIGTKLVEEMIKRAKEEKCHKLIMTSRYGKDKVHSLYTKIGFADWGKEFRMNLN